MTVLLPHHNNTSILTLCMTVYLLAVSFNSYSQGTYDNSNLDAFNVTIKFDEIGSYIFPALYEDPDGLYLPVDALFNLLKVVNAPSSDGQVVKGYFETPVNAFEINLPQKFITFKGKTVKIEPGEATMDMGSVYLKTAVYERAFGFKISFNFRALFSNFTSDFELPVIKLKKQEQARARLRSKEEGIVYDTIVKRDYHWLKGGMLDWSVASSQAKGYTNETRMELGGGAELLGGETNVFLNASNVYGMKREQQQYSWRWANNNACLVKQIQLGRVNSRSIASVLAPVDGFVISNTPTTVRKALGNYVISDHTDPDWFIELYVNNVLIGYTKADASGFYSFTMSYYDRNYVEITPIRRTAEILQYTSDSYDDYAALANKITGQEKYKGGCTVDASIGKSLRLKNGHNLNVNLQLCNLLNNTKLRSGGYEQGRFDYTNYDVNKFPPYYYYAQGFNCYLLMSYRF